MVRLCSLAVLIALSGAALSGPAQAAQFTGVVEVIDGDTIRVGGQTVRLHGIDAPERDQRCGGADAPMWACGEWVRDEVIARYDGQQAVCATQDRDRYGRIVARCSVAGRDLGQALVRGGLAWAFDRYSKAYVGDERRAAAASRGLHGAGAVDPAAHRAAARAGRAAAALQDAPEGCRIKGNISADGKRIHHLPGQRWYDATRISEAKGERWFCSEADARAAGWRRARQ